MPTFVFTYRMPKDYVPGKTLSTCRRGLSEFEHPWEQQGRSSWRREPRRLQARWFLNA